MPDSSRPLAASSGVGCVLLPGATGPWLVAAAIGCKTSQPGTRRLRRAHPPRRPPWALALASPPPPDDHPLTAHHPPKLAHVLFTYPAAACPPARPRGRGCRPPSLDCTMTGLLCAAATGCYLPRCRNTQYNCQVWYGPLRHSGWASAWPAAPDGASVAMMSTRPVAQPPLLEPPIPTTRPPAHLPLPSRQQPNNTSAPPPLHACRKGTGPAPPTPHPSLAVL